MYQVTCPACGKVLNISDTAEHQSLTCPRCLARLTGPATGQRVASVDREVQIDMKGTGCALVVLSPLGGLGLFLLIAGIIDNLRSFQPGPIADNERLQLRILSSTAIVCGAILAAAFFVGIRPSPTGARSWLGTAGIGCLALVAAFIVFFVGCTAAVLQNLRTN